MAKALSRKVHIYINGKEVEGSIEQLSKKIGQLAREQRQLPIGTQEYIDKSLELRELRGVLHEQKVAVNDLGNDWKSLTEKVANFSNIIMGFQSVFEMFDAGVGKLKDLAADAAALDDVYADVQKTTGLTHEEVEKLNKAFTKGKHRPHTYRSGKKAGTTEYKLRNKVQFQLKSDAGEVAGVLFQFPVHGIFREYGVGRGAPRSMGNSVRRSMSDWFSGALNRKENKMLDIVAEHQADKVVRTFMGVKK